MSQIKTLFAFAAASAFSAPATGAPAESTTTIPARWATVSVSEAKELIDSLRASKQKFLLLDVRTPEEVAEGFIPGALNIPLGDLPARVQELAEDRDLPVVVYCRSGNRSARASEFLVTQGFTKVTNVDGGMRDWTLAGYPVEKP